MNFVCVVVQDIGGISKYCAAFTMKVVYVGLKTTYPKNRIYEINRNSEAGT